MRKTKGMLAATILSLAIAGCSGQTARKFEVDNEHNSFTIKGTDVPAILRKAYPDFMDNAQKTPNENTEWCWSAQGFDDENTYFIVSAAIDSDGYVTQFTATSNYDYNEEYGFDNQVMYIIGEIMMQCESLERPNTMFDQLVYEAPNSVSMDGCHVALMRWGDGTIGIFYPEDLEDSK